MYTQFVYDLSCVRWQLIRLWQLYSISHGHQHGGRERGKSQVGGREFLATDVVSTIAQVLTDGIEYSPYFMLGSEACGGCDIKDVCHDRNQGWVAETQSHTLPRGYAGAAVIERKVAALAQLLIQPASGLRTQACVEIVLESSHYRRSIRVLGV